MFGPKSGEVTAEWRRLRSEELCDLYLPKYSGDKINNLMERDCSTYVDSRGTYRVLVRRRGGKRPLGRNMYIFENYIKMDRQEVGWGHALDWPGCGQGHCK
jgi:hypothetical protein